ncbi:MAG: hypothetical protein HQL17_05450 [Candidatus Omnitrophica bacterium]|nr:hypothetical protein [Candidatus Omnitrophota bacterium]
MRLVVSVLSLLLVFSSALFAFEHSYKPKEGYVPDGKTAIKIAEAVLSPIYTQKVIDEERPLNAVLKDGVWEVTGTLSCGAASSSVCDGGVAIIEISKDDGKILRVSHGK